MRSVASIRLSPNSDRTIPRLQNCEIIVLSSAYVEASVRTDSLWLSRANNNHPRVPQGRSLASVWRHFDNLKPQSGKERQTLEKAHELMKDKVSIMVTAYKIDIKSAVGLLSIVFFFTAADHVLLFQALVELFSIRKWEC